MFRHFFLTAKKSAKVPGQSMLALDVPVLNRPGEDMEHFLLVRRLGKLWYLEPGGQYAHAFEGLPAVMFKLSGGVACRCIMVLLLVSDLEGSD